MNILFINPACLDRRISGEDAQVVPIGLYYMAALLMEKGHGAQILNLAAMGRENSESRGASTDTVQTFTQVVTRVKPDIIGFSVTNPSRINAMDCARAAKTILPKALLIFGGPAPTFMADQLFEACPVDIIVRGEGEITCLTLAGLMEQKGGLDQHDLSKIKGLVFKDEKGLVDTGLPDPVKDLDSLVHPSKYFTYQHLAMSRGCPGKCTFCGSPDFWGKNGIRFHSPDWFFNEILALNQKGVNHFYISDDTFTMDKKRAMDLCERIISAKLSITWNAISRVDYIDGELLSLMRRAGCIQISYGVESGAEPIKKILGKPIDNKTCIKAFDLTRQYGILPRAYFIYGSPKETKETIEDSVNLMLELAPLGAVFYMLVVFPGTRLYARACQKKMVPENIWSRHIEDLPWFELDDTLDFKSVKSFGDRLRTAFFSHLDQFAASIDLKDDPLLYPFHRDFLSRLAMTFSQGEYSREPRVKNAGAIGAELFEKALAYGPDPRAYLGLAMDSQKKREFSRAVEILEKGLANFPKNRELSMCMGVTLMNLGDFESALAHFSPVSGQDQKPDPVLNNYINICKTKLQAPLQGNRKP